MIQNELPQDAMAETVVEESPVETAADKEIETPYEPVEEEEKPKQEVGRILCS